MLNKKLVISLIIFSIFMVITSVIKTKTREIEKNILLYEKKIANLQSHLHEAELDYYYLSSPKVLSNNILEYSNEEYLSMEYSKIYFSLDQFLNEQNKTTKTYIYEKNTKKK
tara:strand:- start:1496 stop:1831 length:336 start_codon:yes stop_codon:yes gene_type:complete